MEAFRETDEVFRSAFPVDVFVSNNLEVHIDVRPHWHACIEILYLLKGNILLQILDHSLEVKEGSAVLIHSGEIHRTHCPPGEDVQVLVLKLMPEVVGNGVSSVPESRYIFPFLRHESQENTLRQLASDSLYSLFMGILKEFSQKLPGYELYVKSYIYQIIAELVRSGLLKAYNRQDGQDDLDRLQPLLRYIEEHYTEDISLGEAAKMVNLSYFYFSRYFRRITGRTFVEYIDFVRVCEAEKLLVAKEMSIAQVAYEVGFKNISSFNRVFKRIRSYTPSSVRGKFSKEIGK